MDEHNHVPKTKDVATHPKTDLPGSGKSHACWEMQQRDNKVLSVCPTRELKQKYGKDGVTLNKFFSVNFKYAICLLGFDHSHYDTVVSE